MTAVRREIDLTQAAIVRRIFEWYANGKSPGWIADELNREGVPSPGASWDRATCARLGAHRDRGTDSGNRHPEHELYIGRYVWNRSQWRKDPDTGKHAASARRDRMGRDGRSCASFPTGFGSG